MKRAWGSKGIFDCWAVFPDRMVLIQCKSNYCSKQEWAILYDFAKKIKADNIKVEVWFFRKPRIPPEIKSLN